MARPWRLVVFWTSNGGSEGRAVDTEFQIVFKAVGETGSRPVEYAFTEMLCVAKNEMSETMGYPHMLFSWASVSFLHVDALTTVGWTHVSLMTYMYHPGLSNLKPYEYDQLSTTCAAHNDDDSKGYALELVGSVVPVTGNRSTCALV